MGYHLQNLPQVILALAVAAAGAARLCGVVASAPSACRMVTNDDGGHFALQRLRTVTGFGLLWSLIAVWSMTLSEQVFPTDALCNPWLEHVLPNWTTDNVVCSMGYNNQPSTRILGLKAATVFFGGCHEHT
jgi:L-asparagine transporter-like permease